MTTTKAAITRSKIDLRKIQVGDLVFLKDPGVRWTLNVREDYSKKSREVRDTGGWFLVMEAEFCSTKEFSPVLRKVWKHDYYRFVIYHTTENYWDTWIIEVTKKGKPTKKTYVPFDKWLPQE